jgi:FkbM family methyltransferase
MIVTETGAEIDVDAQTLAKLASALRGLGSDQTARSLVVSACRVLERNAGLTRGDVRESITGPLIDAMHVPGMRLRKQLADGAVFDYAYRSKIARDFVLSPDEQPDHVWEPQTTRLLVHFAKTAKQVAIGGGYIGDHAVLVARALLVNGGKCHTFELNHESAELMRENAANNGVRLEVNEIGLWNEDNSQIVLEGNDSHARPLRADAATTGPRFATTTLDSYGRSHGIEKLDLLMLDIEGAEQAALEGARGFLNRPAGQAPVVVFEIHRSYVDWSSGLAKTPLIQLMTGAGYQVFAIRDFQSNVPMQGCKIELLPLDAVYLEGPPHGFNMLAVKDPALLDESLFRIVRDKSPKLLLHKSPELHHPTEWLTALPAWLDAGTQRR